MLRTILSWRPTRLIAENENTPVRPEGADARALATGAALAVAVDTSPAVLVSIYDYAHRYRDKGRRAS